MGRLEHIDEYQVTRVQTRLRSNTGLWPALAAAARAGEAPRIDSLPAELYDDEEKADEPGMFDYDEAQILSERLESDDAECDALSYVFSIDDYRRLRDTTSD